MNLVAIDFETADHGPESACAIGLARLLDGVLVEERHHLIRPPRPDFFFSYIHGLTWDDVCDAPDFAGVWDEIGDLIADADFLLAHNASFDRRVLNACCAAYDIAPPDKRFACTVQLARRSWGLHPTKLPDVCRFLAIPLDHHDAASDARACALIAAAALAEGVAIEDALLP